jgi:SAM-dependent methyltransferase
MQIDEQKLMSFIGQVAADLGGAFTLPMVRLGDQLGFYKALATHGPCTSHELSAHTGTAERYVREWLYQQTASEYLSYDADKGKFELTPEKAMVLAVEDAPTFLIGAWDAVFAAIGNMPKVQNAFQTGEGITWGDHGQCAFCATERLFRSTYLNFLVQHWLPQLDGVIEHLQRGAKVADIGCGHGLTTVLMAKAFPNSQFVGFDFHEGSINHARDLAKTQGVVDNLSFDIATAKNFPGTSYDLICAFDCLHDMGDPIGATSHVKQALAPTGTFMVVEPFAEDNLVENLKPRARLAYAASVMVCVPTSLAQEVGLALGAQAGSTKIGEVLKAGGFTSVRKAYADPNNMVLEARL